MRTPTRFRSAEIPPPTPPTPPPAGPDATVLFRAAGDPPEVRDNRRLCFYPAVFNKRSQPITEGGRTFTEVILPGAFRAALDSPADVYACLEHDAARTFARRSEGLTLVEDPRGLFATCYLAEGAINDQILADARAGVYRGCSFAFRTVGDGGQRWSDPVPGGLPLCELLSVELIDVCLTVNPAYPATVLNVRADGARVRERRLRLIKVQSV